MAKNSIIPVFIPHAGCPHSCVFCNQRSISGHISPPDASGIAEIIDTALEKIGGGAELAFYGGSFTAIPAGLQEEYLSAVQPYIQSGRITKIRISTRPDAIDADILSRLEKYCVRTIELGAQSMDDDVLLKSGRGHTSKDTENAAILIKSRGFSLVLQMMVGLPGDTPEKAMQTCRKICAISPDSVRIYPVVVLRGTELYRLWKRGEYTPPTVEEAVEICAGLLNAFIEANIPVIRLGLNPSDELSGGEAVAGAYHPALGELVLSRLFRAKALELLSNEETRGKNIIFFVHKSRLGAMAGCRRENIIFLKQKLGLGKIKILPADCGQNELIFKFMS
jgi:histone acetyltransferase (RNA polymerase elongator complex component)